MLPPEGSHVPMVTVVMMIMVTADDHRHCFPPRGPPSPPPPHRRLSFSLAAVALLLNERMKCAPRLLPYPHNILFVDG